MDVMVVVAWLITFVAVFIAVLTSLRAAQLRDTLLAVNIAESQSKSGGSSVQDGVRPDADQLGRWQWCPSTDEIKTDEQLAVALGCVSQPPTDLARFFRFVHVHDRSRLESELSQAAIALKPFRTRFRMVGDNGVELFVELFVYISRSEHQTVRLAGVLMDISAREHVSQTRQGNLYRCAITQMPNRAAIQTTLSDFIATDNEFAVIILDLLSLKRINESLGLEDGDQLIVLSGQRIQQVAPPNLLISHVGGGQFVAVMPTANCDEIRDVLERIVAAFQEPVLLDALPVKQGLSAGVALYKSDASTANELLSCAHLALNHAKKQGHFSVAFYSRSIHARVKNRLKLESALDQACKNGELELVYQPKVDAKTGLVQGAEALLRWRSEEFGEISPEEFIGIAEYSEEILPIGRWVIEQSCSQLAKWRETYGVSNFRLALNLSPKQFADLSLVEHILGCLAQYNLSTDDIEFEVTESLLVDAFDDFKYQFDALKQAGIRIVIDDFGTGYSSFCYLQNFAFDGLKIDRAFVSNYDSGRGSAAIIKALVAVAKALNMDVVAEGIESDEMGQIMAGAGCDELQGFYYGAAQSALSFQSSYFFSQSKRAASGDLITEP